MKASTFDLARLNLLFLVVSMLVMDFCLMIFPGLRDVYWRLGASLPVPTDYFYPQCWMIQTHPIITLAGLAVYYAFSVYVGKPKMNAVVNFGLLLYFAAMMAGLGLPFLKMGQAVGG